MEATVSRCVIPRLGRRLGRRLAGRLARTPALLRLTLALTKPRRFLVLCYHRVNDSGHPFFGGTPTALFREQMQVLREGFAVLFLDELVERAASEDVPANAVAITFDDGYRDNYANAFPILRELRSEGASDYVDRHPKAKGRGIIALQYHAPGNHDVRLKDIRIKILKR